MVWLWGGVRTYIYAAPAHPSSSFPFRAPLVSFRLCSGVAWNAAHPPEESLPCRFLLIRGSARSRNGGIAMPRINGDRRLPDIPTRVEKVSVPLWFVLAGLLFRLAGGCCWPRAATGSPWPPRSGWRCSTAISAGSAWWCFWAGSRWPAWCGGGCTAGRSPPSPGGCAAGCGWRSSTGGGGVTPWCTPGWRSACDVERRAGQLRRVLPAHPQDPDHRGGRVAACPAATRPDPGAVG